MPLIQIFTFERKVDNITVIRFLMLMIYLLKKILPAILRIPIFWFDIVFQRLLQWKLSLNTPLVYGALTMFYSL